VKRSLVLYLLCGLLTLSRQIEAKEDMLCGPRSLQIAAGRIGVWMDFDSLVQRCNPSTQGTTMLELTRAASYYGIDCKGRRLSWSKLYSLDTAVVLLLNENHFVAVDPREKKFDHNGKPQVRVYDSLLPPDWIGEIEYGHTKAVGLVLQRKKTRGETKEHPLLLFNEVVYDDGVVNGKDAASHNFVFRNTGSAVLSGLETKKDCRCSSATLSKTVLQPGECGVLRVVASLKGLRGGFQKFRVLVKSGDPGAGVSIVQLQCWAKKEAEIRPGSLNFGEIVMGESRTRTATVSYYCEMPYVLKNTKCRFLNPPTEKPPENLSLRVVPGNAYAGGFPVNPGEQTPESSVGRDRVWPSVRVERDVLRRVEYQIILDSKEESSVGRAYGVLEIELACGNNKKTLPVEFEAEIVPELRVVPGQIFLGFVDSAKRYSGTVEITDRKKGRIWRDENLAAEGEFFLSRMETDLSGAELNLRSGPTPRRVCLDYEIDGQKACLTLRGVGPSVRLWFKKKGGAERSTLLAIPIIGVPEN